MKFALNMHIICTKKVLIGQQKRDFFAALVLMLLNKFVPNSTFVLNSRKMVQTRCHRDAGTKMHICFVGNISIIVRDQYCSLVLFIKRNSTLEQE